MLAAGRMADLLVLSLLVTAVAAQSQGPFDGQPPGRPVSAQLTQLTGDDPTGRGAVLVRVPGTLYKYHTGPCKAVSLSSDLRFVVRELLTKKEP